MISWNFSKPYTMKKKINDLILITACIRFKNLYDIAKSIYENMHSTSLNILWVIALDMNNIKNPELDIFLPKFIEKVEEYGINYKLCMSGKPNQKNYGGDMFNDPLKKLRENEFRNKNAFVYILDDDNIVHPFLFRRVDEISKINNGEDKIYVLTCVGGYGEICDSYSDVFMGKIYYPDMVYRIPYQLALDPSQALHTLDLIFTWEYTDGNGEKRGGGFPGGAHYDVDLYQYLYKEHSDLFVTYDMIDEKPNFACSLRNTYHNGLRTKSDFDRCLYWMDNSKTVSSYMVVQTEDLGPLMFPVPKDITKETLEKMLKG